MQNVEERIQQRALTLVGGGIKSTSKKATARSSTQKQHPLSNRQRKKQIRNGTNNDKKEETFHLLLQLNTKWNDYVRKLVSKEELSDTSALSRKLASHLELVGAFVRITKCCAHKQWVGREGMIVGTTVNTWRIAWIPRQLDNKQRTTPLCCSLKLLVVPKHGSQVAFSIPQDDIGENTTVTVVIHG